MHIFRELAAIISIAALVPVQAGAQGAEQSGVTPGFQICQQTICLQPGSLARVSARPLRLLRHEARVLGVGWDTLYLVGDSAIGSRLSVPLEDIHRLDVSIGRRGRAHRVTRGITGGALLGLLAGGAIGWLASDGPNADSGSFDGFGALIGAPVGAIVGGLLGGVLGWDSDGSEHWRRLQPPYVRTPLSASPAPPQ